MTFSALLFQALNGLSTASGLFLVAVGLSLIFGVTRIVNIAHGSLYMLGTYIAYSFATQHRRRRSASGAASSPPRSSSALIGALIEIVLLRRIYRAPELFQLLATFALVLVINDAALWLWGPEDLLGPRAPGLRGAVEVLRPPSAELRSVPDRYRPAGSAGAAFRAGAHALRPAGARGDAGPRNGRRARRQSGGAVHRACSRSARRSPASAARCRSRASRPTSPSI